VRIDDLEIDDHMLEKIEQKHGVYWAEVEEVCRSDEYQVRQGRGSTARLFGRTRGGRYLLVVLARYPTRRWKVVTARDMTLAERRLYQEGTR
jgi:uncharacterized DUF497 family protein